MEAVTQRSSRAIILFGLLTSLVVWLVAQNEQEENVYLPDLGIIIEPDQGDSSSGSGNVDLMMGKEPPGADFIESTKELRAVLKDLDGRIDTLDSTLNLDVEAVRLENERLRALIRKIQATRKESEVTTQTREDELLETTSPPIIEAGIMPAVEPSYRAIFLAYGAGRFEEVLLLSDAIDGSVLGEDESIQIGYWRADAFFRLGHFEKAQVVLGKLPASGHELVDDAIVLQGLIYMRQGRPQEAKSRFELIVSRFPSSEYLRLAELTIKELNHL